ncbi:insulin-like growth factor binding proteinn-terminal [Anaeramoeba flamelloides]|uniref:Insulin-like growth factor binding proteinn-terminal n=1 Tax=Anaeramoeba flamelloides TaxID=1746091 RepID=A0AAV7Z8N6_9EUKA|nr:insulin-like growth factor binding proteinn-terminal [Anaeramoeba flamelloides]
MKTIILKSSYVFLILVLVLTNKVFLDCQRYVKVEGTDEGSCETAENACLTILFAVGVSTAGDTVCVGPGTYNFAEEIKPQEDLTLLATSYPEEETIIDGESCDIMRGFTIQKNNFTINGFTIQNFNPVLMQNSWGIPFYLDCERNDDPKLVQFINCNITNNVAEIGTIYNSGCNLYFENVTIQNNNATLKSSGLLCTRPGPDKPEITYSNLIISNNNAPTYDNIVNNEITGSESDGPSCVLANGMNLMNCDECNKGGNCNLATGDCDCLPGSSLPSCEFCQPGQYSTEVNSNICSTCDVGEFNTKSGLTECSDCGLGYYQNQTGESDCLECEVGHYANETAQSSCRECETGHYQNQTGQSECQKCDKGEYQDHKGQSFCEKCEKGSYNEMLGSKSKSDCLGCPKGTYNNKPGATSMGDCLSCQKGFYNSNENQSKCLECETGTYANQTRQLECHECDLGFYQSQPGQSGCKECEVGNYQNETAQSYCQKCGAGYYADKKGQSECLKCKIGYYVDEKGLSTCTDCKKGSYAKSEGQSQCQTCEVGHYQNETAESSCRECETGSYTDERGQSECQKCDKGEYQDHKGQSFCEKCEKGSYNEKLGSKSKSDCLGCPKGTYNNKPGATSMGDCLSCQKGFYNSNENQPKCQECLVGHYQDQTRQYSCHECETGSYTNQTGQSGCQKCDKGEYQDHKGQNFCNKCLSGSYNSKLGSTSENDCIQCEIGTYSDQEGASSCKLCSQGQYNNNRNSTTCLDCQAGSYSNREGQTFCKHCLAGEYQDQAGTMTCQPCPFNTWQSTTRSSECNYCSMHSITLTTNTINPKECFCIVGYYGEAGQNCEKCPENGICDQLNQQYPNPKEGYWSSKIAPLDLIKCKIEDACPGNEIEKCNDELGYTGIKCEECMEGFYKFEEQCLICPDNNWARLFIAFVLLLIFVLALIFIAKKGENYFGSLTILVSFFQIIVLFPKMYFNWPFKIQNFFKNFTFFNLNIDMLALECSFNLSYTEKWFLIMLLPIVIILLFVCFYYLILLHSKIVKKIGPKFLNKFPNLFIKPSKNQQNKFLKPFTYLKYYHFSFWVNGMDKNDLKVFMNNCINSFVAFIFLMYLILCLKIFEIFDCAKISNSNSQNYSYSLKANLKYNCYDGWWYKMLPFVIIFGILYIIGIPVFLGWSLYYHSRKVDENTFNQRFGLLTSKFRKEWFFWEFVLTFRKITVVVIVLYLSNSPNIQIIIFIILFLFLILIQSYCNPFNTSPRNFLEFSLLVITEFILFCGLYFVSEEFKNSSEKTKDIVANLIIFFLTLSIFLWLVIVIIEIKSTIKARNKLKLKNKLSLSSGDNIKGNRNNNKKKKRVIKKKNLSNNEKKFIKVIQNKSNFLIILKYCSSINNTKKLFNFFNYIKQFTVNHQSNNEKYKIKNQNVINSYKNIWINNLSTILLRWYTTKATFIQKISFSRLLNRYIMFIIQNPQNNQKKKNLSNIPENSPKSKIPQKTINTKKHILINSPVGLVYVDQM